MILISTATDLQSNLIALFGVGNTRTQAFEIQTSTRRVIELVASKLWQSVCMKSQSKWVRSGTPAIEMETKLSTTAILCPRSHVSDTKMDHDGFWLSRMPVV